MFHTIFVPLDGSPFAEQALPYALSLARRADARLELVRAHLCYADKEPSCAWLPYEPDEDARQRQEEQLYLQDTADLLNAVSPGQFTTALLPTPLFGAGPLLERLRASKPDLVVMATHGRRPVARFFLGSIADEVVRHSGTPVLLVPAREPAPGLIPEPPMEEVLVPLDGSALAEEALDPATDLARLTEARCTLLRAVSHAAAGADAGDYLERIGARANPPASTVEAVVLTHIHADHTGFAERVRRERGVPVFVHEDDLPASRRIPRLPPVGFFTNIWRPFVRHSILRNGVASGAFRTENITAARPFRDGDRLDVPGRPKVIHAPGHTPGESMLYLEDREVLISGDALVTLNLLTGEHVSPCVPYRLLNHNDAQARRSVARLRELGRVTMLPGHGRPWQGTIAEAGSGVGMFVTSPALLENSE